MTLLTKKDLSGKKPSFILACVFISLLASLLNLWISSKTFRNRVIASNESARSNEARSVLEAIGAFQESYKAKHGFYAAGLSVLKLDVVFPQECMDLFYFKYSADEKQAAASRCTAMGRYPDAQKGRSITYNYASRSFSESPFKNP